MVVLYGMIGYAGLRTAKTAADPYSKLLGAGITSLIMFLARLYFFAVLGMAPLTGVPLPFISYGSSNLIVLLGGMGLLLNIADTGGLAVRKGKGKPALRGLEGGRHDQGRDSRRRDGRARGPGPGRRGRATG